MAVLCPVKDYNFLIGRGSAKTPGPSLLSAAPVDIRGNDFIEVISVVVGINQDSASPLGGSIGSRSRFLHKRINNFLVRSHDCNNK